MQIEVSLSYFSAFQNIYKFLVTHYDNTFKKLSVQNKTTIITYLDSKRKHKFNNDLLFFYKESNSLPNITKMPKSKDD